ncbi:MAG: ArsA family ATPase [Bradymonadaceae bacterium]
MSETSEAFDRMLRERDVLVCAGSGGVGKTTTSAVIGLQAAISGQDVLVMTIDPARRLANSLGIESLGDEAQEIPLDQFEAVGVEAEGRLSAMMLDMKASFDRLVERQAPDEETRDEILENRIYEYFSTSLAGTQEYAAAERLYEIHQEGGYDLLILDTPPTTHALDFLEAPERMAKAVENKAFQWLYNQDVFKGQSGFGLFSVGSSYVLKTLSKFTGRELLAELSVFLQSFSPMFEGFKERAELVRDLLTGDRCSFLVVTSPDPHTKDEALHFYEELGTERVAVEGFVVNRVHPHWVDREQFDREPEKLAASLAEVEGEEPPFDDEQGRVAVADKLLENAASFYVMAVKDARSIEEMREYLARDIPIATVPYFAQDIHSLSGLDRVRQAIFS